MKLADYLAPDFPGQSRVLPDLYYNRHRDYDPTTGRYIQADPIGLDGGQNSYAYAGGIPSTSSIRWDWLQRTSGMVIITAYSETGCIDAGSEAGIPMLLRTNSQRRLMNGTG